MRWRSCFTERFNLKPTILGPDPDALWPMLHEVSGTPRLTFHEGFVFWESDDFTPPLPGATIVVVEHGVNTLSHEVLGEVNWFTVPHPSCGEWYAESAHRLAVGLLLEELLCQ